LEFFAFGVYDNCLPNEMTELLRAPLKILMDRKNYSKPEETSAAFLATLFAVMVHPIVSKLDLYISLSYVISDLKEDQKQRLDSYVFSVQEFQFEHEAWLFYMHLDFLASVLEAHLYELNAKKTRSVFTCIYDWYDKSILWATSELLKWRRNKHRKEFNPTFLFEGPNKL
jgi:hypothetical protein